MKPKPQPILAGRLAVKISEAAAMVGVSHSSIRRAITRGLIKPCRHFRHVLIPITELEKLVSPVP